MPVGCGTCRLWGGVVWEDGVGTLERPERCPSCGRHVEVRLIRRIIRVPPEGV